MIWLALGLWVCGMPLMYEGIESYISPLGSRARLWLVVAAWPLFGAWFLIPTLLRRSRIL
jgi:hypothetical protein